ncbi:MAG: hypothetical protein QOD56_2240, partial [Gammaproteobacteria bacterium]|nr:hypothetical protein [Gammaproteobacteria bacterium]
MRNRSQVLTSIALVAWLAAGVPFGARAQAAAPDTAEAGSIEA